MLEKSGLFCDFPICDVSIALMIVLNSEKTSQNMLPWNYYYSF